MHRRSALIGAGFGVLAVLAVVLLQQSHGGAPTPAPHPVPQVAPSPSAATGARPAPAPAPHPAAATPPPTPAPAPATAGERAAPSELARQRAQLLDDLRESGSADEDWNADADTLFALMGKPPASFESEGCFVAGCGATFTFPSREAYQKMLDSLPASEAYRAWTAGKRFSTPEVRPDGSVVVTIVLYRPD